MKSTLRSSTSRQEEQQWRGYWPIEAIEVEATQASSRPADQRRISILSSEDHYLRYEIDLALQARLGQSWLKGANPNLNI